MRAWGIGGAAARLPSGLGRGVRAAPIALLSSAAKALALAALLVSLGGAWAETGALADVRMVRIKGNAFLPETLTVKAGTTVRWTNEERRTSHSILFPAEGPLESERLLPEESWQRRFDKPGRYPYTCGPHPEMKGVVVVTE